MLTANLYNTEGEYLGEVVTEEGDHPVVPRIGEHLRISEGIHTGDYKVTFVRWRVPEADLQICCSKVGWDSWPELDKEPKK